MKTATYWVADCETCCFAEAAKTRLKAWELRASHKMSVHMMHEGPHNVELREEEYNQPDQ